jgi:hypothetical protein
MEIRKNTIQIVKNTIQIVVARLETKSAKKSLDQYLSS